VRLDEHNVAPFDPAAHLRCCRPCATGGGQLQGCARAA
jgi:hypothetical protein